MASPTRLRRQAEDFAARLTATVRHVAGPGTSPFLLRGTTDAERGTSRLVIRQEPSLGIELNVQGQPLLRLRVDYQCTWDHAQRFLAVHKSGIAVFAAAVSEPLLRYEYLRTPDSDIPGAHVQVHAYRDALTDVMAMCGDASPRARRRGLQMTLGSTPRLADLHLPLGGPRFRPCLEDILQMLVSELGVDAPEGARQALAEGREQWRRDQLAAGQGRLRDCCAGAVRAGLLDGAAAGRPTARSDRAPTGVVAGALSGARSDGAGPGGRYRRSR